MLPGLADSYLQIKIIIITVRAAGPAIDIFGRHYGVDHLHEPGRSPECSSNSGFPHGCVHQNVVAISDIRIISCIRVFYGIGWTRGFTP